jgi:hypothetical protein
MVKPSLLLWALSLITAFSACANLGAKPSEKELEEIPAIITAKPLKEAPGDSESQKLLKALYNERLALLAGYFLDYRRGEWEKSTEVLHAARRLMRVGMELHDKSKDKIDLLKQLLEVSKKLETFTEHRAEMVPNPQTKDKYERSLELERHKLREFNLEVEIEMLKVKKAGGEK